MEQENLPTLAKNFPDVFAALLKRMSPAERQKTLSDFQTQHPKDFQKWYKPDIQIYVQSLDT